MVQKAMQIADPSKVKGNFKEYSFWLIHLDLESGGVMSLFFQHMFFQPHFQCSAKSRHRYHLLYMV